MRIALFLLLLCVAAVAKDIQVTPQIVVVDGDTIKLKRTDIRIVGHDSPEIFHPRCASEKALGLNARSAMVDLLSPPHVVKAKLLRNRHGILEKDKYGRRLGRVYSDGQDVSAIMIKRGLGKPYMGAGPKPTWC